MTTSWVALGLTFVSFILSLLVTWYYARKQKQANGGKLPWTPERRWIAAGAVLSLAAWIASLLAQFVSLNTPA